MSTPARAFICGVAGPHILDAERAFIAKHRPWGLILFKRNVADRAQLIQLTGEFREIVGREDAPVLIDQEGGRVQRMGPPHWPKYPPAAIFAQDGRAIQDAIELARLSSQRLAYDLREVGITVDCLPVLDVPAPDGHGIIGDRAYSDDPEIVARLGRAAAEGLLIGGVLPVMKHIPGHGRARADSHLELPLVTTDRETLARIDFAPFRALADLPMAMTAHVVYAAIDAERPATLSHTVVEGVIRGEIGYDGLLMTDDLSMKALSGGFAERAKAALAAGCDMLLHCNGDPGEASAIASAAPILEGRAAERAARALARLRAPIEPIDPVDALRRIESKLAAPVREASVRQQ